MTFTPEGAERLDKYLARMLPQHSRTKLAKVIAEGQVLVNGKPQKPSFLLTPGDTVAVADFLPSAPVHNLDPADIPLDILYEDVQLLVVNKPRGLASHPASSLKGPSLVNALLWRSSLSSGTADFRPGIVHRLDKETTGLLVVAKTDPAHWRLARQIATRAASRRYFAVVQGKLDQEAFRIDAPIARDRANRIRMAVDSKGRPAVTHVHRLGRVDAGDLVMIALETGRTHQIRVHMAAIGHPVVGDTTYGAIKSGLPLQLHAAYLSFDHPSTGERMSFYAPPPSDFLGSEMVSEQRIRSFEAK